MTKMFPNLRHYTELRNCFGTVVEYSGELVRWAISLFDTRCDRIPATIPATTSLISYILVDIFLLSRNGTLEGVSRPKSKSSGYAGNDTRRYVLSVSPLLGHRKETTLSAAPQSNAVGG